MSTDKLLFNINNSSDAMRFCMMVTEEISSIGDWVRSRSVYDFDETDITTVWYISDIDRLCSIILADPKMSRQRYVVDPELKSVGGGIEDMTNQQAVIQRLSELGAYSVLLAGFS